MPVWVSGAWIDRVCGGDEEIYCARPAGLAVREGVRQYALSLLRNAVIMSVATPKVAICFPSPDMVHADFALSLAGMCHSCGPLEVNIINNKSSIVATARNNGVQMAQEWGAEYLFFVDSDMVFSRATLLRLLLHKKDIVGATYTKRVPPYPLLGVALEGGAIQEDLVEMSHMPTGCLLIRMAVFEPLSKPYFRFENDEVGGDIVSEDYVFCNRARAAGFQVWCDTVLSREIGHIGQHIFRIPAGR
jgi:hypothetical protein